MLKTSAIQVLGESRSFQTRHGSRVAIVGAGLLGTTLALRHRQAGRLVTVFEAAERVERRGHASVASRDRFLLALLGELDLAESVRWESARQPGVRFGAILGGRAQIIETLRDRARAIDVDLRLGTPVRSIAADSSGFAVDTGGEIGEFDEVVLTVPSSIAAELLSGLGERDRLRIVGDDAYVGIISVSFVLRRAPGQRYISRVTRGREQYALVDPTALSSAEDSRNVVYVSRPVPAGDELFSAGDRRVIERFARALPGSAEIIHARVMRAEHAFAQRPLDSFTSSIPGLSIVNASHMGGGHHYFERTAALATTAFRTLCAEPITA